MQTNIVNQIGAIQSFLVYTRDQLPHDEISTTPLPVIAAPQSWVDELCDMHGEEHLGQGDSISVHGCSVVVNNDIDGPVLVPHFKAGERERVYRVDDILTKSAQTVLAEQGVIVVPTSGS